MVVIAKIRDTQNYFWTKTTMVQIMIERQCDYGSA